MSLSREQVREQMLDYLYGELEGDALAKFEAALGESEQSRRELAALQATLSVARAELSRDAHAQPPAHVRALVLAAANAKLASGNEADREPAAAPVRAAASEDVPPARRFLRWLRSVWILPSLVAATAAALLVFRQGQPVLPTNSDAEELQSAPAPRAVIEPEAEREVNTEAPPSAVAPSGSGVVAPHDDGASAPPARKARVPRARSRDGFATPPADWRRGPSTETKARAPSPDVKALPRPAAESARSERAQDDDLLDAPASQDRSSLGSGTPRRSAPPSAPAPAPAPAQSANTLQAEAAESAPEVLLTAAALERRANEHAVAKRWSKAAADYRELLRRFPQDPRRKRWAEQLDLALRSGTQPPNNGRDGR